ncbi:MAG: hypothetical protein HKN13_04240 [Rhodothermales bacterium]|nr:hypothetical protein [Rhodothermales bacterium]
MAEGIETPGKVKRIADDTRGLVDDVKTWVDLRLQLTQLEIEGQINQASAKGIVAIVAIVAVLFALAGIALLIGDLTGRSYLGFFAVAGVLFLITLIVWMAKPQFVRIDRKKSDKS